MHVNQFNLNFSLWSFHGSPWRVSAQYQVDELHQPYWLGLLAQLETSVRDLKKVSLVKCMTGGRDRASLVTAPLSKTLMTMSDSFFKWTRVFYPTVGPFQVILPPGHRGATSAAGELQAALPWDSNNHGQVLWMLQDSQQGNCYFHLLTFRPRDSRWHWRKNA